MTLHVILCNVSIVVQNLVLKLMEEQMKTYFVYHNKLTNTIKLYITSEEAWNTHKEVDILSVFSANENIPNYYLITRIEELVGRPVLINGIFQIQGKRGVFKKPIERPVSETEANWKDYYVIEWTESEAGWGQRPDGFTVHETLEDARSYAKDVEKEKHHAEFSFPTTGIINIYSMKPMVFKKISKRDYTAVYFSKEKLFGQLVYVDNKATYPSKNFKDTGLMAKI